MNVKWSDEHLLLLKKLYLTCSIQPKECMVKVNEKFGTSYNIAQVRRAINDRGWSKKRKALIDKAKVAVVTSKESRAIVSSIVRDHKSVMEDFGERAKKGAKKAFDLVETSGSARELSAAAAAAKSLVSTYRVCYGLDQEARAGGPTFNFNFAAAQPTKAEKQVDADV